MESTSRIIDWDAQLWFDLFWQGLNTILIIVCLIAFLRLCFLGIKALKIYIEKNKRP